MRVYVLLLYGTIHQLVNRRPRLVVLFVMRSYARTPLRAGLGACESESALVAPVVLFAMRSYPPTHTSQSLPRRVDLRARTPLRARLCTWI